jgi:hypothetical protein
MIIKERGLRMSLAMVGIILPLAVAAGGLLNWLLRVFDIKL